MIRRESKTDARVHKGQTRASSLPNWIAFAETNSPIVAPSEVLSLATPDRLKIQDRPQTSTGLVDGCLLEPEKNVA